MKQGLYAGFYSSFITICKQVCKHLRRLLMEVDKDLIELSIERLSYWQINSKLIKK